MKTIYPQETLDLLAKYDELLDKITEEYQQEYPDPPEKLREMIGEQRYAEKFHEARDKRRRASLADPIYQTCMSEKTKIIMISPCTYQLDADEMKSFKSQK
jgi:hypothetical protein